MLAKYKIALDADHVNQTDRQVKPARTRTTLKTDIDCAFVWDVIGRMTGAWSGNT